MYSYLDRPITNLDEGGKVLVWAMRRWVCAVEAKSCPVAAISKALSGRGLMPALAPFHRMMGMVAVHGRQDLAFAPFCHSGIEEGEALMLALVAQSHGPCTGSLDTTALLLVGEEHRACLHDAVLQLGRALAHAGMLPVVPAPSA